MAVTHHDIEPGQEVYAHPARAKQEKGGWFKASVLKKFSRGAQVRYLEGHFKGRDFAVDYSRLRLTLEDAPPDPKVKKVKESAVLAPLRDLLGVDADRGKAPPKREEDEVEDVEGQVDAWLEMGRELTLPLERRAKELDDEIAWLNGEVAALEELRVKLGEQRAELDTKMKRLRKLVGEAAK